MKKILVAFDGSYYSESALQFAIGLAKREEAQITGVFLEDVTAYHQFSPIFEAPDAVGLAEDVIRDLKNEVRENLSVTVNRFKKTCDQAGIHYLIEMEEGIPSLELLEETQFADLCVVGSVTYFSNLSFANESRLLSDLLGKAHCPVLVVPEQAEALKHVILTYDGSASSVYAIKRYVQLFARTHCQLPSTLLTVVKHEGDKLPQEEALVDYLSLYCDTLQQQTLVGKPSEQILYMAKTTPGSMVVMGGYGRNAFSQLLKSSVGKKVVNARTVPVLVAHE